MTQEEINNLSANKFLESKGYNPGKQFAGDPVAKNLDLWMEEYANLRVAAERSRLLSQAGVPSDEEINDLWAVYTSDHRHLTTHASKKEIFDAGVNLMRSRMSALLLKEREEKDREMEAFGNWIIENYHMSDDGKWCLYKYLQRQDPTEDVFTTAQLLAKFREWVEKGGGA